MAFGSGPTRTLGLKLEADVSDAAAKLNSVDGKLGGFKSAIKGIGATVAAGFAVDQILEFGKSTITAASNTQESMNKVQAVFGDSAKSMTDFILEANKIGLSDEAAANYAGTLGNMFNQLGFTTGAASDMSQGMITLAADLGSFNDLPTADVLDAMNSAFRGEYDSLERVIPTINAAAVQQKALEMTGKTSTAQLTEQEKAAATYQLVMSGAGQAVGDFARTQDSAANQAKTLSSNFDDMKAAIGERLLPVMEGIGSFILNDLIPAFEAVWNALTPIGEWISDNLEVFQALGIALGVVGAVILATLVPAFIAWAASAGAAAVATIAATWPLIAIGAVVAGLAYLIIRNWDTIKTATGAVWDFIKAAVSGAWNFISGLMSTLGGIIRAPFESAWTAVQWVWARITSSASGVRDALGRIFAGIGTAMTAPIRAAWNALASAWNATVGRVSISIPDFVPGIGGKGFNVPNLPKLAKGGIVTGPTIALLGEAGPEKVIPLGRNDSSRPIVVNIQAGVGDPVEIGRQVAQYLSAFEGIAGPQYRETRLMAWSDHVTLRLQVASTGGHGPDVSKWAGTSDPHKSRWTPASTDVSGSPGRWESTLVIRDQQWTNWDTIPWADVICDAMTVSTAQGWAPFSVNTSPNSAAFVLVDPVMDFAPAGPDLRNLGIGFDLPVRLVAHWHDPLGGEIVVWAGLIREIIWSATPDGERRATIRATEVTEVYGRTEPETEGATSRPQENLLSRFVAIHALSDMPNLFPSAVTTGSGARPARPTSGDEWMPGTGASNLVAWSSTAGLLCAPAVLDHNLWSDLCHWANGHGLVTVALNYYQSPSIASANVAHGSPRLVPVVPLAVRYPKETFLEISDTCSDPAGYPFQGVYPTSPRVRISPRNLTITSSQSDIANDLKVAFAGTTGNQAHKVNQSSVGAYGRHTWGRNDLRIVYGPPNTSTIQAANDVAWKVGLRSSMARDKLEALDFPVTTKRDLQALVGHYRNVGGELPRPMQPGRTAVLTWDDPEFPDHALLITRVEHQITPGEWTTRLGCEMFDMDHFYGKDYP